MNKFLPIIMSGILALPTMAFAASSVRTLGGAGTYNGVTSVGSGTATRAGSVRAVPAVKVSSKPSVTTSSSTSGSTGAVSGNTGTGTRMSMGKYLSGLGAAATKVSTSTSTAAISDAQAMIEELGQQVNTFDDETKEEFKSLWAELDAAAKELEEDYVTKEFLRNLKYIDEDALDDALDIALAEYTESTEIESTYAKKGDIANIIAGAVESGDLELSGYAKTSDLGVYAKGEDVDTGFDRVNVELTNVGNKITDINTKINTLEAGAGSLDLPTSCDGDECLYMLSDTTTETGSVKAWHKFGVADTFDPDAIK